MRVQYQKVFIPLQSVGKVPTVTKKKHKTKNIVNILKLSEQEIVRRNNLQQLRDLGIDPYPAAEYPTNAFSAEIKENFIDLPLMKNDLPQWKTADRYA